MDITSLGEGPPMIVAPDATSQRIIGQQPAVPPQAAQAAQPSAAPTPAQLKNAVDQMNQAVQNMPHGSNVEFSVDDATKIKVIRVVDKSNNEVITQYPAEDIISIARTIDSMKGMIVNQKA